MSMQEMIRMKERATMWVDTFWENCTPMSAEQLLKVKMCERYYLDDTQTVAEQELERGYNQAWFYYERFRLFGLNVTSKALGLLMFFAKSPGDVSMNVAAIAHVFYAGDIENTKLITCQFLVNLFENKWLTDEANSELWKLQKNPDGKNLIDNIDAFKLLTTEESEWLAANEVLSEPE